MLIILFKFNCLFKDPITKYGHVLKYWEYSIYEFWLGHNQAHNSPEQFGLSSIQSPLETESIPQCKCFPAFLLVWIAGKSVNGKSEPSLKQSLIFIKWLNLPHSFARNSYRKSKETKAIALSHRINFYIQNPSLKKTRTKNMSSMQWSCLSKHHKQVPSTCWASVSIRCQYICSLTTKLGL